MYMYLTTVMRERIGRERERERERERKDGERERSEERGSSREYNTVWLEILVVTD